eukprot:761540_1
MAEEKINENGFVEWTVTGDLLTQFKNAKQKDLFCSPQFKTIDGSVWKIKCWPHGDDSPGHCAICLQCVTLNSKKRPIGVNFSFNIVELDWVRHLAWTFTSDGETCPEMNDMASATGPQKLKVEKLNDLDTMTIRCVVQETMDVREGNTYFEWKISKHMHLMERYNINPINPNQESFMSPIFNAFGEQWFMTMGPNGFAVLCKPFESDEKKINVCHYIGLHMGQHQMNFDGNIVTKKKDDFELDPPFNFESEDNKLGNMEITVCVKLWEKGSINNDQIQLISNIHAEKMRKANAETMDALQKEIAAMKAKLEKVAMKEIKTIETSQEIVMDKDRIEQQNEFKNKMKMDEKRLNEWKVDSISIKNELTKPEQKECENANDATTRLLNRFMECKSLCDAQRIRMENVILHCTKLNKMKKVLKKESVRCDETVNTMEKECHDLNAHYQTLQSKRSKLQTHWMAALREMNRNIDEENKTNAAKCGAENQYNVAHLEATHWNHLYAKCVQLIKQYRLFDSENEQNMQKMKGMFESLWITSMKRWFEWHPQDIINWLKYLHIRNELTLCNEFDFDNVLNEMIKSKMNGLSLATIDKTDLKTVGVMALNDRQQIYHKINELMAKYPYQKRDVSQSVEGQSAMSNIPNEFVCPLTNKIMRDPVKIFDNNTYEREAIEAYLKEHNKSPITGEECEDEDDHWTLPDRKLKERIQIFVSVNNISLASIQDNQLNQTQFI